VLRPEYIDDVHAGRMDEDDERCNRVDHLVKRNDKLPLTTTGKYATSADNQRQIHLVVYEQGGADLSDRIRTITSWSTVTSISLMGCRRELPCRSPSRWPRTAHSR